MPPAVVLTKHAGHDAAGPAEDAQVAELRTTFRGSGQEEKAAIAAGHQGQPGEPPVAGTPASKLKSFKEMNAWPTCYILHQLIIQDVRNKPTTAVAKKKEKRRKKTFN